MATIQVRDIPEDAYEVIRRRARAEGKSIQVYMRERVIDLAQAPTKAESVAAIERALAEFGALGADRRTIARDIAVDRR